MMICRYLSLLALALCGAETIMGDATGNAKGNQIMAHWKGEETRVILSESEAEDKDICKTERRTTIDSTGEEERYEPRMKNERFEWDTLDCDSLMEINPPIYNQSTWMNLRSVYHRLVGLEKSTIAPQAGSGFRVPFNVKLSPDKGRGVFAADKVRKGDLILSDAQSAKFEDGETYLRFLSSIPKELVCDVVMWTYVQEHGDEEVSRPLIVIYLDEGSLMNHGSSVEDYYEDYYGDEEEEANVGCFPEAAADLPGGCKDNYFAIRDIEQGEEFLCNYGDFAIPEGWEWFGL